MTKAYKVILGTKTDNDKKFVVWTDCPINAKAKLHAPYETKVQHIKDADDLQPMGTVMPWNTYLQKEAELVRSKNSSSNC